MKPRDFYAVVALGLCALFLNACQSTPGSAPPVSASLVRAGGRVKADAPTLAAGRTVFVNRCIQCHALPDVSRFDAPRLTAIVGKMSHRANLNPVQHDALLKYLLTVRSL
jgi:mono/diheme cytochrome c family protein